MKEKAKTLIKTLRKRLKEKVRNLDRKQKITLSAILFVFSPITFWNMFDETNPVNLYLFTYPVQHIRAFLEVQDFKPHLILKEGDCRIQNTISAIKDDNLYIVLGKAYNRTLPQARPENHQWTTLNPDYPSDYKYIVDHTTGLTEEVKRQVEYIPYNVYKLDVDKCKVKLVRQVKKDTTNDEKHLLRLGEFYIEAFCKYYKEKYQYKRGA